MNKELTFRKKLLEWAINFSKQDLSSLSELQREKLKEEIVLFIMSTSEQDEKGWMQEITTGNMKAIMQRVNPESLQNALGSMTTWLIENLKRFQTGKDFVHFSLRSLVPTLTIHTGTDGIPRIATPLLPDRDIIEGSSRDPEAVYLSIMGIISFEKLLWGLPLNSIMTCKGCGEIFVNFTKKGKLFCGSTCYNRHKARERIEALKNTNKYKAYLKKQAKYQRERYRRLRKAQFGPNNKIKIGRKEK